MLFQCDFRGKAVWGADCRKGREAADSGIIRPPEHGFPVIKAHYFPSLSPARHARPLMLAKAALAAGRETARR